MFTFLRNALFGRPNGTGKAGPKAGSGRAPARMRYDAASDSPLTRKMWAHADSLDANTANSVLVRETLRKRARYEVANNSYAAGMADTLAIDVIGSGPRIQIAPDEDNDEAESDADLLEAFWQEWADAIDLGEKLRTMRRARFESGECFLLLSQNPNSGHPVTLDVKLVEADQCARPWQQGASDDSTGNGAVDGIEYDSFGNPAAYWFLRAHPGSGLPEANVADRWPAASVLHYFRRTRPAQGRGVPDITPSLPLFGMLRRFTIATVTAAEAIADIALAIESQTAPIDPQDGGPPAQGYDAMDTFELEPGVVTVIPAGYKLTQPDAKQPVSTYREFKAEILNEIGRPISMPYNIIACNSSSYNYSSGRLDHQTYDRMLDVDRKHVERIVLRRIFAAFMAEAQLIEQGSGIPQRYRAKRPVSLQWIWQGRPHVDPKKESDAAVTNLNAKTTTRAAVCAERGDDWRSIFKQIAREQRMADRLEIDLTSEGAAPPNGEPQPQPQPESQNAND